MNIDFFAALRYPFVPENRMNAWIIPALVMLVGGGLAAVLNSQVLFLLLGLLGNVFLLGYLWQMSYQYQQHSMSVSVPDWSPQLLWGGLKLYPYFLAVYFFILGVLVQPVVSYFSPQAKYVAVAWVAAICVSVYLLPLLVAPVIFSARTLSFRQLINVPMVMHFLSPRYGQCNQAMLFVFFLLAVYVAFNVIVVTLLTFTDFYRFLYLLVPFGVFPFLMSAWHLINQGFLNSLEE